MKTAATVLQEMMVKLGDTPEYDCVAQSGPQHLSVFEYQCRARGVTVRATARSKKEAKQEAARIMLLALVEKGYPVTPPWGSTVAAPPLAPQLPSTSPAPEVTTPVTARSYKALLKELCEEYRLGGVEYEVVGDVGPPHLRQFTVEGRVGQQRRRATASTKKTAHQRAAEELYHYFRENLSNLTSDFVEEQALVRAHEKAMQRYVEVRVGAARPDLSLQLSQYHRGLLLQLDEEQTSLARAAVAEPPDAEPERRLQELVDRLSLQLEYIELDSTRGKLSVAQISGCTPELALAGRSRPLAAAAALRHLRLALEA